MCIAILKEYDIALLLNLIISNSNYALIFSQYHDSVFVNLELVVKLIYYNPVRLTEESDNFLKSLLESKNEEFNRLGLFSLYCISLAA